MALLVRDHALLCRLRALLACQRLNHTLAEGGPQVQLYADSGSNPFFDPDNIDILKWRKLDARTVGIYPSMISPPTWTVLKVLQNKGFEAYLVGGCVRDLILKRIPKDFDVITTASLKQIKKQFHKVQIIGQRFPICWVKIKDAVIEVSSFDTVAKNTEDKQQISFSQMSSGYDRLDLIRWRNCMRRDFTINSLFFDPFVNKIYDYANGMADLKSFKLRTLVPAQLSFEEDCARILRGLRIAARLGLSLSKETAYAICKLSSSIASLAKTRLMLELNYMLSYGAAVPSLCLLQRFKLLEVLLPFHAAYLSQRRSKQSGQGSIMLMKLFSNLDGLVNCAQPSDCSLWVAILAFHLALVNDPQHPLVVSTFGSVLYHGKWKQGVEFARKQIQSQNNFLPEILDTHDSMSDEELAEKVAQLALAVQDSVDVFTETGSLFKAMRRFPDCSCSGLVFVPQKVARKVAGIFDVLAHELTLYEIQKESDEINYVRLGKGNLREVRFSLGIIIINTMGCAKGDRLILEEHNQQNTFDREEELELKLHGHTSSDQQQHHVMGKDVKKRSRSPSITDLLQECEKKVKSVGKISYLSGQRTANKHKAQNSRRLDEIFEEKKNFKGSDNGHEVLEQNQEVISFKLPDHATDTQGGFQMIEECQDEKVMKQKKILKKGKHRLWQQEEEVVENFQQGAENNFKAVEKVSVLVEVDTGIEQAEGASGNNGCFVDEVRVAGEDIRKHYQDINENKGGRLKLSSLFK